MNYEEIVKALKKEQELDKELGKVGDGVDEQLLAKKVRNGRDLDSLDGVLD
tara:strand:- start:913 stop:1065 length:153 start_codon:yes stop_codon:yes gene_type:complete